MEFSPFGSSVAKYFLRFLVWESELRERVLCFRFSWFGREVTIEKFVEILNHSASRFSELARLGLIFMLLEWFFPVVPQKRVFRRQIIFDLLLWFLNPFSHLIAFLGVNWVLSTILGGPPKKWIEVGGYPFGVQLFLLILMIDVLNYWTHRLLHTRWLWPIHAVHHSAQEMDWLSGTRVHPLQSIIWILPTMTVMQFVHTNVFDAAWVGFLFRFQLALAHSNLAWDYGWLGQWVVSPLFHRWHHTFPSQGGEKNFAAIFTVCDRLFGTLYVPQEGDRPLKLGVLKPSVESFE